MNKHVENIIKSINRHKRGLRDPQIMHPERDWGVGLFLALLVFTASASWSLSLYVQNRNASNHEMPEEQTEAFVYREALVEEALTRLKNREDILNALMPPETQQATPEEISAATSTSQIATSSTESIGEVGTSTESGVE